MGSLAAKADLAATFAIELPGAGGRSRDGIGLGGREPGDIAGALEAEPLLQSVSGASPLHRAA